MHEPIANNSELHAWRRAVASEDGPPPTTRLVLLVLSLRMNRTGYCFPHVDTVSTEAGLSERATGTHLAAAAKAGWIKVGRRGGKNWRQRDYQATRPSKALVPLSPAAGSGDPRSGDPGSGDPGARILSSGAGDYLSMNSPRTIQGPTPSGDQTPPTVSPDALAAPKVGRPPESVPARPATDSLDGNRPGARNTPERSPTPPSGGFLNSSDLVNGLRKHYPHPSNGGAPRRVPTPVAVENWIGEAIQLGRLDVAGFQGVLDAAKSVAKLAADRPDDFRRALKTWIKEAAWGETVDDAGGADAVVIPPPSKGPRFTPRDWNKQTTKENHERLDEGRRA